MFDKLSIIYKNFINFYTYYDIPEEESLEDYDNPFGKIDGKFYLKTPLKGTYLNSFYEDIRKLTNFNGEILIEDNDSLKYIETHNPKIIETAMKMTISFNTGDPFYLNNIEGIEANDITNIDSDNIQIKGKNNIENIIDKTKNLEKLELINIIDLNDSECEKINKILKMIFNKISFSSLSNIVHLKLIDGNFINNEHIKQLKNLKYLVISQEDYLININANSFSELEKLEKVFLIDHNDEAMTYIYQKPFVYDEINDKIREMNRKVQINQ